jgi:DNA-binding MarR family transcriptional regulator
VAAPDVTLGARALTDVVGRLRRALRRSIRADYPWEQLPMARVELLHALTEMGPTRVGELARAQRLAPNTVSELVQQLVDDGYATRSPDPRDGRASIISATPRGIGELRQWTGAHENRILRALTSLSAADQTAIRRALPALDRLVDHLEGDDAEPGRGA